MRSRFARKNVELDNGKWLMDYGATLLDVSLTHRPQNILGHGLIIILVYLCPYDTTYTAETPLLSMFIFSY